MAKLIRGRPKLVMTKRRHQVLAYLRENGERISLYRLKRECGFYGEEDAKRVLRDLREMGLVR